MVRDALTAIPIEPKKSMNLLMSKPVISLYDLSEVVLFWREIMKNLIIILFLSAFALVSCTPATSASPEIRYQTEVHLQAEYKISSELVEDAPDSSMKYIVWLPEGYGENTEKQWPLILFLHGSGSGTNDSVFVIGQGLPEVLYKGEQPEDFPFVVISPQAFDGTPWWVGVTPEVLLELLDEVAELYKIDTKRIYLTGLSMGGYGSWLMAAAYPERFAAMVSTAGTGYGNINPTIEQLCKVGRTPLWAFHGAQDVISDPIGAKIYIVQLQKECENTEEIKWTLYPDEGHLGTYQRAYRDPELYTWLLEHSLEE